MKKLTEILAKNRAGETYFTTMDAVIESYLRELRDGKGEVIWYDEKNQIARCSPRCETVIFFFPVDDKFIKISLSPASIRGLAKQIDEIESQVENEFIDF